MVFPQCYHLTTKSTINSSKILRKISALSWQATLAFEIVATIKGGDLKKLFDGRLIKGYHKFLIIDTEENYEP